MFASSPRIKCVLKFLWMQCWFVGVFRFQNMWTLQYFLLSNQLCAPLNYALTSHCFVNIFTNQSCSVQLCKVTVIRILHSRNGLSLIADSSCFRCRFHFNSLLILLRNAQTGFILARGCFLFYNTERRRRRRRTRLTFHLLKRNLNILMT